MDSATPARTGALLPEAARVAPPARQSLWLAVLVLTALNLRPFLTAIGPLASDIAAATGLDLRGMAWLTLLPMLLMGVGAWCGPALQQRLGARRVLLGALAVLALGSALRAWAAGGAALIATAALCGLGVAFVQAVFPGVIKRQFPGHVAPLMGLYSAALVGGGAGRRRAAQGAARWRGGRCRCWPHCCWPGVHCRTPRASLHSNRAPAPPAGCCSARAPGC